QSAGTAREVHHPQERRRLVGGDGVQRVERPEQNRPPALRAGLDRGRVVRVGPAVAVQAPDVEQQGDGEQADEGRARPADLSKTGSQRKGAFGSRRIGDRAHAALMWNSMVRRTRKRTPVAIALAAVSTAISATRDAPGANRPIATIAPLVYTKAAANASRPPA